MGGGNGQKAKMARERNLEKQKAAKGTHYTPSFPNDFEDNNKSINVFFFFFFFCFVLSKVPILVVLVRSV
jgi:hypothetical protein